MYLLILAGILATFNSSIARADFASDCSTRLARTSVKVVTLAEKPEYDDSKSLAEIQQMARNYERNKVVLGITLAQPRAQISTGGEGLREQSTGQYCFSPDVTVTLTYDPIKVYVAQEFKPGTCEHSHILRHENDHVKAYHRKLREGSSWLEGQLKRTFNKPYYMGSKDELTQQIREAIQEYWLPLTMEQLKDAEKYHQRIDSPEEYAKNNTACNGKINQAITSFRKR